MLRGIIKKPTSLKAAFWDFKPVEVTLDINNLSAEKATKLVMLTPRAKSKTRCFTEFLEIDPDCYESFAFFINLYGVEGFFPFEQSKTLQKHLGWDGDESNKENLEISREILDIFRKEIAPKLKEEQLDMKKVVEAWRPGSEADSRKKQDARREALGIIKAHLRKISVGTAFKMGTLADISPEVGIVLETKNLLSICYLEIQNWIAGADKLVECQNCYRFFCADRRGKPKYCPRCRKDGYEIARQKKFGPDYKREYGKMVKQTERARDRGESQEYKRKREELDKWLISQGSKPRKRKAEL